MSGTLEGGRMAAKTNKELYGQDFYVKIGALGGRKSRGGGFAKNNEMARLAGQLGGVRGAKVLDKEKEAEILAKIKALKG